MTLQTVIRRPSAFLPIVMSIAALMIVLSRIAIFGTARQVDEGVAAHIFQLLIVAQMPVAAFFAIKWFPRVPRFSLSVLGIQLTAVLAALAPVYFLHL